MFAIAGMVFAFLHHLHHNVGSRGVRMSIQPQIFAISLYFGEQGWQCIKTELDTKTSRIYDSE